MNDSIETIYVLKSKYKEEENIFFVPNHKKYLKADETLLKTVYTNPEILKKIDSSSKIIPYAVEFLTVGELKQLV